VRKGQDLAQAQQVYSACRYPGARARAIRVLEKQGRFGPAYALLKLAMQAPESEAERQQLLRIAPRLARQLGLPPALRPRAAVVPQIDLVLPAGWQSCRAGRATCSKRRRRCSMSRMRWPIRCLACCAGRPSLRPFPVPSSTFQRGPADLLSADFAARRRELLERCLGRLDDGSHRAHILATYKAKQGIQSPFVAWGWITRDTGDGAGLHPGRPPETVVPAHPGRRARESQRLPDLVQFWPQEGRYRMIEVKGPGDRLQDNQRRWLDYCAQHQMPVAVCYLQWEQAAA
jgi:hypothetical protein